MNPVDMLSSTTSSGRRMPRVLKDERTDGVHVIDNPSRPCPGCDQVTREGDSITRIFRTWWHLECARLYLRGEGRGEAWRVMGEQLSARPGDFTRSQTREIVRNLLDLVGGDQ